MFETLHSPSALFWPLLTRLGEAQILLPLSLVAALWLGLRAGQAALARRWMLALAAAVALTTLSKLAFMGWGLGIAALDFTGFSGHSMFAAATLPMLASVASLGRRGHGQAAWLGLGLAALVAVSRVQVSAHSPSEALAGFALGALASLYALRLAGPSSLRVPLWLPLGVLAMLISLPFAAPRSRTHDWVTALSLQLSGRSQAFTRADLHRLNAAPVQPV
ncbi:phosphatase [Paucibacter sp. APW11]|uniref:Phosphatase n=1 Tax=Roseateles aquae TaxID=3077235 RepID=A0ABU3PGF8_9BURK|nr:phosphatase [Paucibacter sp. APW11]MDT9001629.1 phosphatase [Paucibacter sp. APW11]